MILTLARQAKFRPVGRCRRVETLFLCEGDLQSRAAAKT